MADKTQSQNDDELMDIYSEAAISSQKDIASKRREEEEEEDDYVNLSFISV